VALLDELNTREPRLRETLLGSNALAPTLLALIEDCHSLASCRVSLEDLIHPVARPTVGAGLVETIEGTDAASIGSDLAHTNEVFKVDLNRGDVPCGLQFSDFKKAAKEFKAPEITRKCGLGNMHPLGAQLGLDGHVYFPVPIIKPTKLTNEEGHRILQPLEIAGTPLHLRSKDDAQRQVGLYCRGVVVASRGAYSPAVCVVEDGVDLTEGGYSFFAHPRAVDRFLARSAALAMDARVTDAAFGAVLNNTVIAMIRQVNDATPRFSFTRALVEGVDRLQRGMEGAFMVSLEVAPLRAALQQAQAGLQQAQAGMIRPLEDPSRDGPPKKLKRVEGGNPESPEMCRNQKCIAEGRRCKFRHPAKA